MYTLFGKSSTRGSLLSQTITQGEHQNFNHYSKLPPTPHDQFVRGARSLYSEFIKNILTTLTILISITHEMLHSLEHTQNTTLDNVSLVPDGPVPFENLEYTANSSLFISHPNEILRIEELTSNKNSVFETSGASSGGAEQECSQANSDDFSLIFTPLEKLNATDKLDSSGSSFHDGLRDLELSEHETDPKHTDEADLPHSQEGDNEHLSISHKEHALNCFELPSSHPHRKPSKRIHSPHQTPLKHLERSIQVSPSPFLELEDGSECQSSSLIDDTQAQFDLDINIDEYKINVGQRRGSPWRNFRSTNLHPIPLQQKSVLNKRDFSEANTAGVSSTDRIEDLSKQLTNCKIQLKLYEKFLQDLIDNQSVNVDEVTTLHLYLDRNTGSATNPNSFEPTVMRDAFPEKELIEMANLLEDLYASVEEYQNKWRDADSKISGLNSSMGDFLREVASILQKLGINTASIIDSDACVNPEDYLDRILDLLRKVHTTNPSSAYTPAKSTPVRSRSPSGIEEYRDFSSIRLPIRKQESGLSEFGSMTSTPHKSDLRTIADGSIDIKLQEYQAMIDGLQKEVNELKSQSRMGSVSDLSDHTFYTHRSRDREKMFHLKKEYENLQEAHHELINEHHGYKNSLERTVASLRAQLENLQKDKHNLRSELTGMKCIQRDLEVSVEKQRVLTAEKIKLSYQVESLTQDKVSMQKTLETFSEKFSAVSEKNTPSVDALRKRANHSSDLLDHLFELDVEEFEKLLKSFNKIADDDSLEDPRKKIGLLLQYKGTRILDQPGKAILSMRDAHRAVFQFFSRAVDVIVNDHIRLLLKESELKKSHDLRVAELNTQIRVLEERNRQMSERPEYVHSPRLKLRIEELTSRWKAEREARILENRQAEKRLHELEQEAKTNT
ncbi:hypothetical protein METBIDRAFT_218059 [Metschnikowia bicuspidata var. bicuspidata NRRL YB-4993]|uniref:Mto2p-binding domain-containing protein n=1 Tax=Metschnikowia bicuspidata var. bicuspidata NRRL YB-4993 TaxID=869754 RepID=A0A1A0H6J6_9ASCO|nr:hypothetical protein METBIDRAFT_218059 [Metschnikowia bicuspidata var. bicuspidata NRRL YB-4993]OBA19656.1 hypothetical protein METBIDRAFT_218059 [Metschnikowia bicuspidata var. bicuspidata NRRL YB-4993]